MDWELHSHRPIVGVRSTKIQMAQFWFRSSGDRRPVRYVIDGASVERTEIGSRLLSALSQRSSRRMLLKADADLDFGVIAGGDRRGEAGWGADGIGLIDSRAYGLRLDRGGMK